MKRVLFHGAGLLAVLIAWTLAVRLTRTPPSVLPTPADIGAALWWGLAGGSLWGHVTFTVGATLLGVAIGCAAGALLGLLLAEFRWVDWFVMPLLVGLQSMPKVAIAPLIIAYLGYGLGSKVFTVSLLCMFPMLIAAYTGSRATPAPLLDLMRVFGAGRLHVMWHLKMPTAAPLLFAALQICVVLGLIACVVSEFIASTRGLGFLIRAKSGELDVSNMFASILVLAAFGATAGLAVRAAQARVVFWIRQTPSSPEPAKVSA